MKFSLIRDEKMQASEPISSNSFRYVSENSQFSRMKKVILPQVSAHQFYSYEYNDFFPDLPMQIDHKLNEYESSFYMDSSLYTQQDQLDEALAFGSDPCINNYQSGPSSQMTITSLDCPAMGASQLSIESSNTADDYDNTTNQQQLSHLQKLVPQQQKENVICSARKRPIKNSDIIKKRSPEEKPSENEWKSNKKRAVCCQKQVQDYKIHQEIKEIQRERVPVRRSQKLADRITALQKLVSPYGKTDTASVLHEASVFIKVLQGQIENMLNTLRSAADNIITPQKNREEKEFDLRNKGLCLFPVSYTRELIKENNAFINQYCS